MSYLGSLKQLLNEINNLDKTSYISLHTRQNGNKPNIDIYIDEFNIQLKILSFWVCLQIQIFHGILTLSIKLETYHQGYSFERIWKYCKNVQLQL